MITFETAVKNTDLSAKDIELILHLYKNDLIKARQTERDACRAAVAREWAPITGTPYFAGSRRFVLAIDSLPEIK
jgi:hypothetical protein